MSKAAEEIYQDLKQSIICNEFKAQQRISEEALAAKYNVSRTPIREALKLLEFDGFVNCVKNVGTFIRPVSANEISDFFDTRGVLEGLAARLCAGKANEDDIKELRHLADMAIKSHKTRNVDQANAYDREFHAKMVRISGNSFVKKDLAGMTDYLNWFLNISNLSRIDYFGSIPFYHMKNGHEQIINAIETGDPDAAEQHARGHLEEAKKYFIEYCYDKFMV